MGSYGERCKKHPFHTLTGVCPFCLAHRLRQLCPECAAVRPCRCMSSTASSEIPPSSSSSFSFFGGGMGAVRRSTSARVAAVPFLRSKSRSSQPCVAEPVPNPPQSRRRWSFWWFLGRGKQEKVEKAPPEKTTSATARLHRSSSAGASYFPDSFLFSKIPISAKSGECIN